MAQKVRDRRGVILIVVLLLLVILLVLGMGFLTQQRHLHGAARRSHSAVLARALAEAGLEDARAKLEKDLDFPPSADPSQKVFSYSEQMTKLDGSSFGRYTVTIDHTKVEQNGVIVLTSVGSLGGDDPTQRVLYAELDVSGDPSSNARFFRFVHFEDRGGL